MSVRIEPQAAQLAPLTSVDFNARVGGTFAESVTWSIEGGRTDAGTIDVNGLYTAPVRIPRTNEIVVLATSTVDATKIARAIVNILPLPFTPTRGTTAGGTRVTIEGREFTAATQVLFGSAPGLDVVLESSTRLRVTTPAVPLIGAVDVTVRGGSTTVYPQGFHYSASTLRFAGGAMLSTCDGSYEVTSFDVDGDQKDDVVALCRYDSKIVVMLRDANEGFKRAVSVPTNSFYPYEAFPADFDGDGDKDLYIAHEYDVRVMVNTTVPGGAPTFTAGPIVQYPSFNYYYDLDLAVADFNLDGRGDLAFALNYAPEALVQLAQANGTFAAATTYALTNENHDGIETGDVDGDLDPDLIIGFGRQSVSLTQGGFIVLRNNAVGSGVFAAPVTHLTKANVTDVVAADFNGDGDLDVATQTNGTNGLSVRLGAGVATFPTLTNYTSGNYYYGMDVADVDRDGFFDLLGPSYETGYVAKVFYGSASGLTAPAITSGISNYSLSTIAVDIDGQGSLDLVTGAYEFVETYVAQGPREFGSTRLPIGSSPQFLAARAGSDGKDSVLAALRDGGGCPFPDTCGALGILGQDFSVTPVTLSMPARAEAIRVRAVELTGDGLADALVVDGGAFNANAGSVILLKQETTGSYTLLRQVMIGKIVTDARAQDLDGDGAVDLIVSTQAAAGGSGVTGDLEIRWGTGDGDFGAAVGVPGGVQPHRIEIADLDDDQLPELIVADKVGGQIQVVKINAGRTFDAPRFYDVGDEPSDIVVTDVDGDYVQDLVVRSTYDSGSLTEVDVLAGIGSLEFDLPERYRFYGYAYGMEYGDLDGDGLKDLAITFSYPPSIAILRGYDGGRFLEPEMVPTGGYPYGLAILDFDNNGLMDMVVSDVNSGSLRPLANSSR